MCLEAKECVSWTYKLIWNRFCNTLFAMNKFPFNVGVDKFFGKA